jgi:DNA excision repair protein ERCC-2
MASAFLNISRFFDSHYRFFIEKKGDHEINTRLFCMDPSPIFSRLIHSTCSAILFSATFFPTAHYQAILFGTKENGTDPSPTPRGAETILPYSIVLPSPFPKENFKVLIHSHIRTTYRARQRSFKEVAGIITQTVNTRAGNYMVYFPSYAYMNAVVNILEQEGGVPGIQVQTVQMTEPEREAFLHHFTLDSQVTGFAVMGGIFGEGIDLGGDRLIGVIVVGVGLPQICPEQDQIRAYYEARNQDGFFNAYLMPGFNRVMQATGRLIRTETDRGVVVLLDERFLRQDYTTLFPEEWRPYETISDCLELKEKLLTFWKPENKP